MEPKPKKTHGRSLSPRKPKAGPAASTRRAIANGCAQVPHTDTGLTQAQKNQLWFWQVKHDHMMRRLGQGKQMTVEHRSGDIVYQRLTSSRLP